MDTLFTILFTFLTTLLAVYAGWWAREWTLRHRTPEQVKTGEKRCIVCQVALPSGALRIAETGQWRCDQHKGAA